MYQIKVYNLFSGCNGVKVKVASNINNEAMDKKKKKSTVTKYLYSVKLKAQRFFIQIQR